MAHFAEIDKNNIVKRIIVVNNDIITNEAGEEDETLGADFCRSLYGLDTIWVKTSYNSSIRGSYAGEGYFYDSVRDVFIPSKPYESWVLDNETLSWNPPISKPESTKEGVDIIWSELTKSWIEMTK